MSKPVNQNTSKTPKQPYIMFLSSSEQFVLIKAIYFILNTLSYDALKKTSYFDYDKGKHERRSLTFTALQHEELERLFSVIKEARL